MTRDDLRTIVLRHLGDRAPEADLTRLRPDRSFRDQLDLDSVDFLNFLIALNKELGIEVPEQDYPHLVTLNGCLDYLGKRLVK